MGIKSIYLIGFSGTGKSTVASILGERLGRPALDLDRLISERAGLSIPEIFEREGEEGFRARETALLGELSAAGPFVMATGGGVATREENRRLMEASGWVVALEARPELLLERLERQELREGSDAARPLLAPGTRAEAAADRLERIRALKASRQPAYALADWTVHTDRLGPEEVAGEIVRALGILGD